MENDVKIKLHSKGMTTHTLYTDKGVRRFYCHQRVYDLSIGGVIRVERTNKSNKYDGRVSGDDWMVMHNETIFSDRKAAEILQRQDDFFRNKKVTW